MDQSQVIVGAMAAHRTPRQTADAHFARTCMRRHVATRLSAQGRKCVTAAPLIPAAHVPHDTNNIAFTTLAFTLPFTARKRS